MSGDELYVPPEALEAARYALSGCSFPGASAARNSEYERQFPQQIWRAAIKRVLESGQLSSPETPAWVPTFRFFIDIESGLRLAILASRANLMTLEERAYLRSVEPASITEKARRELINKALDDEVRRAGL